MATVTINTIDYEIYGTSVGLDEYINAELSSRVSAINALSADDKNKTLVMATRWIDRKSWAGSKTSGVQELDWPRTGVSYRDGTEVDSGTVPPEIIQATYELAIFIARNPQALENRKTGVSNTQRLKADTVEIWYHSPVFSSDVGDFPDLISELISQFLDSKTTISSGGSSYGTEHTSSYETYGITGQM